MVVVDIERGDASIYTVGQWLILWRADALGAAEGERLDDWREAAVLAAMTAYPDAGGSLLILTEPVS